MKVAGWPFVALLVALLVLPRVGAAQGTPDGVLSGARARPPDAAASVPDDAEQVPAKPPPTPTPDPPSPSWQARQVARLEALDKVDGQSGTLEVAVGSKQVWRNISIDVRSCYGRPNDQAQDAAAYLIIADAGATTPNFVGWMLAAEPAASMMQHPVYDVRVLGCR